MMIDIITLKAMIAHEKGGPRDCPRDCPFYSMDACPGKSNTFPTRKELAQDLLNAIEIGREAREKIDTIIADIGAGLE